MRAIPIIALALAACTPAAAQMPLRTPVAGDTRAAECVGAHAEREQRHVFMAGRGDAVRVRYAEGSDRHVFSVHAPGSSPEDLGGALVHSPLGVLVNDVREGARSGDLTFFAPHDGAYVLRVLDRRAYPRACEHTGGPYEVSVLLRHMPWLHVRGVRNGHLLVRASTGPYGPVTGIRVRVRAEIAGSPVMLGSARMRGGRAAVRLRIPANAPPVLRLLISSDGHGPYDAAEARSFILRRASR